jgi:hypothetical protein
MKRVGMVVEFAFPDVVLRSMYIDYRIWMADRDLARS